MEENDATPLSPEGRIAKLEGIVADLTKRLATLEGAFGLLEDDVELLKGDAAQ